MPSRTLPVNNLADLAKFATRLMRTRGEQVTRGNFANAESWQTYLAGRRSLLKAIRQSIVAADFKRTLMYIGNDSDAGFRFLEAALPLMSDGAYSAECIRDGWMHGVFGEHAFRPGARRLSGVALTQRTVQMFRAVSELQPLEWPESSVVYRGVAAPDHSRALLYALSPSWTLRRDVAAWFATRPQFTGRNPERAWLLMASVQRRDVLAFVDDRHEAEVVVDALSIRNVSAFHPTEDDIVAAKEHAAKSASHLTSI